MASTSSPLVALVWLILAFDFANAIIVSAPDRCGGTHVVSHTIALFGPKPSAAGIRDVKIFAPLPQVNGVFLHIPSSSTPSPNEIRHPTGRRLYMLATLFGRSAEPIRSGGMLVHAIPLTGSKYLNGHHRGDKTPSEVLIRTSTSLTPTPLPAPPPSFLSSMFHFSKPRALYHDMDFRSRQYQTPPHAEPPPHHAQPVNPEQSIEQNESEVANNEKQTNDRVGEGKEIAYQPTGSSHHGINASVPPLFDACIPLSVPADVQTVKGSVVVVGRGVCDFSHKVTLMQNAGAVGVIVVNFEKDGEGLATMKRNDSKKVTEPIDIPSVMISYQSWAKIAPCSNDTTVVFTSEGESPYTLDQGRDALNWAMMRGMALWILCQCGVNVVRYKRRVSEFRARADAIAALPVDTYSRRQSVHEEWQERPENTNIDEDQNSDVTTEPPTLSLSAVIPNASKLSEPDPERIGLIGSEADVGRSAASTSSMTSAAPSSPLLSRQFGSNSMGAAASASRAIPIPGASSAAGLDDSGSEDDDGVCAICLEEFEEGQQVRQLACSHMYHRLCIDPWLQSSSNCCPLCKREVPNLPPPPTQLHYGSMVV